MLTGGRGKAGGIKLATGPTRPRSTPRRSSGSTSAATSSASSGSSRPRTSRSEYYLSVTFDRGEKKALFMLTKEGGIDIEEVAAERPEALARLHVDPLEGFQPYQARRLIYGAGIEDRERAEADRQHRRAALRGVRRRRRDALRDQPADRHARRRGEGARLEVHGRRQRALQAPGHRGDARPRGVSARGARSRARRTSRT